LIEYRVQTGQLNGNYKDVLITEERRTAWACYFKTTLEYGEKKRIQEMYIDSDMKPKTLEQYSKYWTQGRGER
jgi:hypothetical protein